MCFVDWTVRLLIRIVRAVNWTVKLLFWIVKGMIWIVSPVIQNSETGNSVHTAMDCSQYR